MSRARARLPVLRACTTLARMGDAIWKMLGTGGAVLSGIGARKALTVAWTKAVGEDPPHNPASPDVGWGQALAWAVVSGSVVGIAKLLWQRKAAHYFERSTGHLPTAVREAGN